METPLSVPERLFHAALGLPEEERAAFLDRACASNAELRNQVESLLMADRQASTSQTLAATLAAPGSLLRSDEQPGAQIGRYKLLQLIGEGGFGSVWMAEQREPVKRRVALKIIKLGMDSRQVIARFEAERQALAMMDHPNVARVFDAGTTVTGRPYFVMEYIKGVPILEYCEKERLDTPARLRLFISLCLAVHHAHQKGLIHRDLKPGNVLVTMHDGVPVPKVIDFGVAKATSAELTQRTLFTEHRQLIGTPEYMSPEQAEMSGLDIDTRSDVYSLGVLLYELLTGTTPFDWRSLAESGLQEFLHLIREVDPPTPSTRLTSLGGQGHQSVSRPQSDPKRLAALVRGDLDWIVMKCLEKDRTRRYDSAAGLASDVQRHLDDEPVLAGPPGVSYRVRKFVRRHRLQVTAGVLLACVLVLGIIGTSVGLLKARGQTRLVATQRDTAASALIRVAAEVRERAESAASDVRSEEASDTPANEPVQALADATVRLVRRIDELRRDADAQRDIANRAAVDARDSAHVAEENRKSAEAARMRAEQIAGFLRDLVRSADPNADGATVPLVNILRRSDALLTGRFDDQPVVELDLRETIGGTFTSLGAHQDALPHLERTLYLAARHSRPTGGAVDCEANDAWARRWIQPLFKACVGIGDPARALAIVHRVADDLKNQGDAEDPIVELLRTAANTLQPAVDAYTGKLVPPGARGAPGPTPSRADRAREKLADARQAYGEADTRTIDAMYELALLLNESRDEAELLFSTAREAESRLRPIDDAVRRQHEVQYAVFRASALPHQDAIQLLEGTINECEAVAGPDRPEVIEAWRAIAWHQQQLADSNGQLKSLENALRIAQSRLGPAHSTTVLLCGELLPLLTTTGRYDDADRMIRQTADAVEKSVGTDSPFLGSLRTAEAHLLAARGKHQEVVSVLRPVLERQKRAPAFAAAQSFDARSRLVESLIELREWDEAANELEWFAADPKAETSLPDSIRRHGARLWAKLFDRRNTAEPGAGFSEQAEQWRERSKANRQPK